MNEPSPSADGRQIRTVIADDHEVVRRGLRQVLAEERDIVVVGEASNRAEVMGALRAAACEVLVLDLTMPGANGFDLLETVKREQPSVAVLVLGMHPEDQHALRALEAGAAGYMPKGAAAEDLVGAIRKVHAGGRYVTPRMAEALAVRLGSPDEKPPHERLSNRELQVLCMIGRGLRVRDIAAELHLSEKTVSTYRTRLLEKLELKTTAQLIRYALEHHLID